MSARSASWPAVAPVWANGRLTSASEPVLLAGDEGFLLGLSVFDTVLLEEGHLYFLAEHLARLRGGAEELGIPWPPPWDVAAAMRATAGALDGRDAAVRVTLSRGVPGRGPTLVVTTRPLEVPRDPGVKILVSSYRKLGGNPLEGVKSTNRLRNILAREEAVAAGAWEALLPNHDGDLSECTTANIFCVAGGALLTPSEERGCLAGIIREKLREEFARAPLVAAGREVPLRAGRLEPADLRRASEVFLTNTTGRIVPVLEVLGLPDPPRGLPGAAGPVTQAIRLRLRAVEAADRASVA
ncbi:MAG: aminotransferase class IV [Planctomycetota bacterium]